MMSDLSKQRWHALGVSDVFFNVILGSVSAGPLFCSRSYAVAGIVTLACRRMVQHHTICALYALLSNGYSMTYLTTYQERLLYEISSVLS